MTQSDDAIARFSRRGVGEAIAHAYGVRRKGVGSITALFRELLRMEYVLLKKD